MVSRAVFDIADLADCFFRLRILRALVGNIPPHPLWAELVWQRHEQAAAAQTAQAQAQQSQTPPSQTNPPAGQAPPAPPSKPEARVPVPRPQAYR